MPPATGTAAQNRKYLCQAPRPEVWNDISEAVLHSLGATAVAQITQTMAKLQELHDLEPRSGPGRKSNAEHAMHFYQHLLQLATERKDQEPVPVEPVEVPQVAQAEIAEEQPDVIDEAKPPAKDTPVVAAAATAPKDDNKETVVANDGENMSMNDTTPTSLKAAQKQRQQTHNDHCEVCTEPAAAGQDALLCCSTCQLVFHWDCSRPKLDERPDDETIAQWCCSHCVLQSNPKKNSKLRRTAAAAVRLMARLRKQHEHRRNSKSTNTVVAATETEAEEEEEAEKEAEKDEAVAAEKEDATVAPNDVVVAEESKDKQPADESESKKPAAAVVDDNTALSATTKKDNDVAPIDDEMPQELLKESVAASTTDETTAIVEEDSKAEDKGDNDKKPAAAAIVVLAHDSTEPEQAVLAPVAEMEPPAPLPSPPPIVVKRKVGRPPKKKKGPPPTTDTATSTDEQAANINTNSAMTTRRSKTDRIETRLTHPVEPAKTLAAAATSTSTSAVEGANQGVAATTVNAAVSSEVKTTTIGNAAVAAGTIVDEPDKKRTAAVALSTSDAALDMTTPTTPTTTGSDVVVPSSPDGRSSKRSRKQPTLYDPQAGPASRWKTDEHKAWVTTTSTGSTASSSGKDNIAEGGDMIADPKAADEGNEMDGSTQSGDGQGHGRKSSARELCDGVWCSFCKDEADVPICVFCACRVCFGKHHATQLLLCNSCDEEYHTFCLDPPLNVVPTDLKQWYCPSCKVVPAKPEPSSPRAARRSVERERVSVRSKSTSREISAAAAAPTVSSATRPSRTPPSPKKAPVPVVETKKAVVVVEKRPVGRPRGRPPKNPPVVVVQPPPSAPFQPAATRKRDRSPTKSKSAFEPPRKRGRPPSAATIAKRLKAEAEAKKQARLAAKALKANSSSGSSSNNNSSSPTKKAIEPATVAISTKTPVPMDVAGADEAAPLAPIVPVTISRSGRMVRRSSFHDERHEGAQHLKSGRSPTDSNVPQATNDGIVEDSKMPALDTKAAGAPSRGHIALTTAPGGSFGSTDMDRRGQSAIQQTGAVLAPQALAGKNRLKAPPLSAPAIDSTFEPIVDGEGEPSTAAAAAAAAGLSASAYDSEPGSHAASMSDLHGLSSGYIRGDPKQPRRKPGARECMQISRRFGVKEIPQHYIDTLTDYCSRGKVEHLIRMRERLDEHSRFLESQLAGLEALVLEHGESDIVVPLAPPSPDRRHE